MKLNRIFISTVLGLTLALTGCSSDKTEATQSKTTDKTEITENTEVVSEDAMSADTANEATSEAANDVAADLPTYKVAMVTTFEPYAFKGEQNEIIGFNVDIINAIAEHQGFNVMYLQKPWDGDFSNIIAGKQDILGSVAAITPERKEIVDFTDGYIDSSLSAMVKADHANTTFSQLIEDESVTFSVLGNSAPSKYLKSLGVANARIRSETTEFLNVRNVLNGNTEAMIAGENIMRYFAKKYDGLKVVKNPESSLQFGFIVQKGNTELLDKLNSGLAAIKQDNTYDEIYLKWFGETPTN